MRQFDYKAIGKMTFDNEIISLVAQIHECKGRQEMYLSQQSAVLERLVETAKIQSTEASNKIEGIVSTNTRIRQICSDKTTPKNRDEEEITGYRDVLQTIHESYEYIPITSNYILQLHDILYKYSGRGIGGRYKSTQNYISETRTDGTSFIRFTPLPPYETPDAVIAICESYSRTIDSGLVDPLILIPIFISDFLCIHPFNDGNGRMSRLLTTLLLYRSGYVIGKYVSIESKIEHTKEAYYDALQSISQNWYENNNSYAPFIKYILGIVLSAYKDFEDRVSLLAEKLPAVDLVRKAIQKKIGKFTKSDIMELCPSIGKSSVENSLKKLIEQEVITKHGQGKNTFYTRNN